MTGTTVLSWITNFGDAGLTIPVAAGCALWLSTTDKREALIWLGTLVGALVLVGVNKILYAGCGIEIRSIDFRVRYASRGGTAIGPCRSCVTEPRCWRPRRGRSRR